MTIWKKTALALAAVMTAAASPAMAQGTAAAADAAANPCELHIWPAERFKAMTMGWFSGFGVVGAVADSAGHAKGDQGRKAAMAEALDSKGQAEALASLDLATALGQPPVTVIRHDEPLDRKTINKIDTRRATSASPCYSELIVADLLYMKSPIYGRSLRTLFLYRKFGAAQAKPAIYKGWGGNGLKVFPAKAGEDVQAANDELVSVFKADFEEYARNAKKSPELAAK